MFQEHASFALAMEVVKVFNDKCPTAEYAEGLWREVNSLLVHRWPTLLSLQMPCKENYIQGEDAPHRS